MNSMFAAAILLTIAADSGIIEDGAKLQQLGTGFAFTEGPSADKQGNVYFTDQPKDRIMKWSVNGAITEWLKPAGRSNGTAFDKKGNLITCADGNNELWSIAPDKTHTVLIKEFGGQLLNGPNDVWVRPDGGMYITDPLYVRDYWTRGPEMKQSGQHVFFLSADRKTFKPVWMTATQPNGIAGTPDGKTLYVADIGANKTYRFKIEKDGRLTDQALFCNLGSDGMTLDEKGNLYLTGHGVTVFDKTGIQIEHIDVHEDWTANVTFGGQDRRLLFITASRSVYGLRMKVKGTE